MKYVYLEIGYIFWKLSIFEFTKSIQIRLYMAPINLSTSLKSRGLWTSISIILPADRHSTSHNPIGLCHFNDLCFISQLTAIATIHWQKKKTFLIRMSKQHFFAKANYENGQLPVIQNIAWTWTWLDIPIHSLNDLNEHYGHLWNFCFDVRISRNGLFCHISIYSEYNFFLKTKNFWPETMQLLIHYAKFTQA